MGVYPHVGWPLVGYFLFERLLPRDDFSIKDALNAALCHGYAGKYGPVPGLGVAEKL